MNREAETPLLVLTGTTASWKDRVGALVAEEISGEIVTLDSMKVYRGMDLGTDKPTAAERRGVPHHLLDILDPRESMNLRRYVDLATEAVAGIRARGRRPLVVGGTALYLQGFLYGVFEGPDADPAFRAALRAEAAAAGTASLHARLASVDPVAARRIHANDYKRIERALEVVARTGRPITELQREWSAEPGVAHRLYVLTWDRAILDRRIDERVVRMFEQGLVEEVRRLEEAGGFGPQSSEALGYREVVEHLRGDHTLAETICLVQQRTRRFARRQLTWYRRMPSARWIVATPGTSAEELARRIITDDQGAPGFGSPGR